MQELPDDLGNLQSLRKFSAPRIAVTYLPSSLGRLKKLEYMHMGGFGRSVPCTASQEQISFLPPSITNLCSLNKLCLASCDLSVKDIPSTLGQLTSLEFLDLSKNNFSCLPFSLFQLSKLSELRFLRCKNLLQLPELPPNLERFYLEGCTSMEKLPALSQLSKLIEVKLQGCRSFQKLPEFPSNVERLNLEGCTSLEELPHLSQLSKLIELELKGCRSLQTLPELPQHLCPCRCRQLVDQRRN
ncbi:hypothetical protein HAX54_040031 [Datura stramonium]|uniref:Disease resistance R13L4/SHOC-2-like LRR domain-containing protein n=1 Tax=Datura stramonium TaxID=4076 RepID=A0ABS8RN79_DATST|nr:hypothetical protein [Datura stramonium]